MTRFFRFFRLFFRRWPGVAVVLTVLASPVWSSENSSTGQREQMEQQVGKNLWSNIGDNVLELMPINISVISHGAAIDDFVCVVTLYTHPWIGEFDIYYDIPRLRSDFIIELWSLLALRIVRDDPDLVVFLEERLMRRARKLFNRDVLERITLRTAKSGT